MVGKKKKKPISRNILMLQQQQRFGILPGQQRR
jgi:hypothetical protein